MSCEDYGDVDKPHTFAEAVEYLRAGNHIDYEVKISAQPTNGKVYEHQGALMTRETWLESVADHSFIDYDGMGNEIAEDGTVLMGILHAAGWIKPSQADKIQPETKYILWYNR